jgi:hypothetical protein
MNFQAIPFDGPPQMLSIPFNASSEIKGWMFFYEKAVETMCWEPVGN